MTVQKQARIERYRERLANEPASGVFVPLAELLAESGEPAQALAVLEDGLARRPASLSGRVVQGRILLAAGQGDRGREVLGGVLAGDPDNVVVRRLLADDCRERGDWVGECAHLEHLVRCEPGDETWPAALAEARSRIQAQNADVAEAAGFATMTMVDIYIAQGYHLRAAEALRRLLAGDPGREDARRRLDEVEAALAASGGRNATDPDGSPAPEPAPDRERARDARKVQFTRWIERIQDEESAP